MISTQEEVAMGKDIHQSLSKQYKMVYDPARLARLDRIGQRLARVSDRQDYAYHFYLIEDKELNAFTTPGGNIYMYTGLFDKLKTDDQIAAVLAHEMGHCAARHTVKKFQAALGYNLIGSIVLSQIASPESQHLAALSANTVMNIVFSAYSRQDELQADQLGLKYMYEACFDPQASVQTFEMLKAESKGSEGVLLLRSHPYIEDRIQKNTTEIKTLEQRYGRPSCQGAR